MNRFLIAIGCLLIGPAGAWAQTAGIQAELDKELQQARVYEDIEIMRRLLERKFSTFLQSCQKCHAAVGSNQYVIEFGAPNASGSAMGDGGIYLQNGMPGMGGKAPLMGDGGSGPQGGIPSMGGNSQSGMSGSAMWSSRPLRTASGAGINVDGVYAKSVGVILQAQLPAWAAGLKVPPSHAPKQASKPLDEWDLLRLQVRGGKPPKNQAAALDPHHDTIQDVLIQALAEYGKHFQSLADNERLTVAVTFRQTGPTATHAQSGDYADLVSGMFRNMGTPMGAGGDEGGGGGSLPPSAVGSPPNQGPNAGSGAGGSGSSAPQIGPRSSSKDYELLADYHFKQARYLEASKSLQKALELNRDAGHAAVLYRKLASAYLMQDPGQGDAHAKLEKAALFLKKIQDAVKSPPQVLPQPQLLPTRLIITAARSALQKASLTNLDEFRRDISVTWLRFNHPVLGGAPPTESTPGSPSEKGN